jgi:hypothetical protein
MAVEAVDRPLRMLARRPRDAARMPSQSRTLATSPKGTPVCAMPNGPGFMPTSTTSLGAVAKRSTYAAYASRAYSSGL